MVCTYRAISTLLVLKAVLQALFSLTQSYTLTRPTWLNFWACPRTLSGEAGNWTTDPMIGRQLCYLLSHSRPQNCWCFPLIMWNMTETKSTWISPLTLSLITFFPSCTIPRAFWKTVPDSPCQCHLNKPVRDKVVLLWHLPGCINY